MEERYAHPAKAFPRSALLIGFPAIEGAGDCVAAIIGLVLPETGA